ncbi:hypothetical protein KXS11_11770 [Plantibacter flavus]|uniref:hypothetical protein n=1 Tax=Plantibacter flavus TaxID=150123 RepID=UPI003F1893AF
MTSPIQYRVAWWVLLLCAAPTGAAFAITGLLLAAGLNIFPSPVNLASGLGVFAMIVAAMIGALGALLIATATLIVRLAVGSQAAIRAAQPLVAVSVAAVTALAFSWAVGTTAPSIVSWLVLAALGSAAGLVAMLALTTRE